MEHKQNKNEGVPDDNNKVLSSGNFSNSMILFKETLWRPNNYRRKIEVFSFKPVIKSRSDPLKRVHYKTAFDLKSAIQKKMGGSLSKRNGLLWVEFNKNIKIMYAKKSVIAVHCQNVIGGVKEVYKVNEEGMKKKKNEIKEGLDIALNSFCNTWGLKIVPRKPIIWARHEDWTKGDKFIDNIPSEVVIHDPIFKKVYGEGVEFTGGLGAEPTMGIINYIRSRALEDISPELSNSINNLVGHIEESKRIRDPVGWLFENKLSDWFNSLSHVRKSEVLGVAA